MHPYGILGHVDLPLFPMPRGKDGKGEAAACHGNSWAESCPSFSVVWAVLGGISQCLHGPKVAEALQLVGGACGRTKDPKQVFVANLGHWAT